MANYTLGNLPPSSVKELQTTDKHMSSKKFKKDSDGKRWHEVTTPWDLDYSSVYSYSAPRKKEFANIGDLMWEWGQHHGLDHIDPVGDAKAYFENNALIATDLRDSKDARSHAKVLILEALKS